MGHVLRRVQSAFHVEHQGTGNHHHREQGNEVNPQIGDDGVGRHHRIRNILHCHFGHLQHPQHPHHAHQSQYFAALQGGQVQNHQVGWNNGYQVHQAPKAEEVLDAVGRQEKVGEVVHREKGHRQEFYCPKPICMFCGVRLDCFQSQRQTGNENPEIDDCHPTGKGLAMGVGKHGAPDALIRVVRMRSIRNVHGLQSLLVCIQ